MVDFETSSSKSELLKSNSWKIPSFSKTMALQRELFLTMFYTYQPLPITRHQERFNANNYFEYLPIVSTAFKFQHKSAVQTNPCTQPHLVWLLWLSLHIVIGLITVMPAVSPIPSFYCIYWTCWKVSTFNMKLFLFLLFLVTEH